MHCCAGIPTFLLLNGAIPTGLYAMNEIQMLDEAALETTEAYRRRKATSILSVLFTDIADSTALREELGEVRYEHSRETYDQQMAAIISRDDAGIVIKSTGDGMLC